MAQLDEVFDPSTIEVTSTDFTPLPAGDYLIQITEDEMKVTSKGTGRMLNFSADVIDGPYTGRKIWIRVNWTNVSAQAQSIGRELLKKIVEAILGVGATISNTAELHYKPFIATIKIVEDKKGKYPPSNEVSKARSAIDAGPAKPASRAPVAPRPAPAAASAPVAGARAPWPARTA